MSFPRYPKYKDSGVEWLGEVPAQWEVVPLKHLASLKTSEATTWHAYRNELDSSTFPFSPFFIIPPLLAERGGRVTSGAFEPL